MDKRRPVDIKRESGGRADIGSIEDGAIKEMFNLDKKLLIIKERAIYELTFADDIDPKRENPNLPINMQRLILKLGSDSEMVCRTFLTAKRLFKEEFLPASISSNQALLLSIEVLQELAAMESEIANYLEEERRVSNEYEDHKSKNTSFVIPSIIDINTRCKTIFQKADHVLQALMEIIRLFYPDFNKQSYYTSFSDFIKEKYSDTDLFAQFLSSVLPFIELTRNMRNCLDHRRTEVTIRDFELQIDGNILTPTIEIDHLNSKLERTPLTTFLPIVTENMITVFERMIAHLCNKVVKEDRLMPSKVLFIPIEQRVNKYIQYSFWSPFGDGGFFHQ